MACSICVRARAQSTLDCIAAAAKAKVRIIGQPPVPRHES
jgi:hypothetical protein